MQPAAARGRGRGGLLGRLLGQRRHLLAAEAQRQLQAEAAAAAGLARHLDLSAQADGEVAAHAEAEAGALFILGAAAVGVGREDALQLLGRNAHAAVGHVEAEADPLLVARELADAQRHAAFAGELDRVAHQVAEDLAQAQDVPVQLVRQAVLRGHREDEPAPLGLRTEGLLEALQQVGEAEVHGRQVHAARLLAREAEDLVDHGEQVLRRELHRLQVLALLAVELGLQGEFRHAQDAVHGRADLVAQVRQGLGALAVDVLGRLARRALLAHALHHVVGVHEHADHAAAVAHGGAARQQLALAAVGELQAFQRPELRLAVVHHLAVARLELAGALEAQLAVADVAARHGLGVAQAHGAREGDVGLAQHARGVGAEEGGGQRGEQGLVATVGHQEAAVRAPESKMAILLQLRGAEAEDHQQAKAEERELQGVGAGRARHEDGTLHVRRQRARLRRRHGGHDQRVRGEHERQRGDGPAQVAQRVATSLPVRRRRHETGQVQAQRQRDDPQRRRQAQRRQAEGKASRHGIRQQPEERELHHQQAQGHGEAEDQQPGQARDALALHRAEEGGRAAQGRDALGQPQAAQEDAGFERRTEQQRRRQQQVDVIGQLPQAPHGQRPARELHGQRVAAQEQQVAREERGAGGVGNGVQGAQQLHRAEAHERQRKGAPGQGRLPSPSRELSHQGQQQEAEAQGQARIEGPVRVLHRVPQPRRLSPPTFRSSAFSSAIPSAAATAVVAAKLSIRASSSWALKGLIK